MTLRLSAAVDDKTIAGPLVQGGASRPAGEPGLALPSEPLDRAKIFPSVSLNQATLKSPMLAISSAAPLRKRRGALRSKGVRFPIPFPVTG